MRSARGWWWIAAVITACATGPATRSVAIPRLAPLTQPGTCGGPERPRCAALAAQLRREGPGDDPETAFVILEQGCAMNEARACYMAALQRVNGDGVPRDTAAAARMFQRACDLGMPAGCTDIGMMHINAEGMPRDEARALAAYTRACEGGHMRGCSELGVMVLNGEGVAPDAQRAMRLFWSACQGNHGRACTHIGRLVAAGAPSPLPGHSHADWLSEGCQRGDAYGCQLMIELAQRPPPPSATLPPARVIPGATGPGVRVD